VIKECENCKRNFEVKKYRIAKAKFCSYDCYWGRSENISEKECSKCKKTYSINCFQKVNRGFSSSCKYCKAKEFKNWARANDTRNRFRFYEWNAKKHNRDFMLTEARFKEMVEMGECFYCGDNERLGIDRIDSNGGYIEGNIIQCCRKCNVAKNNLNVKDFIRMCVNIAKRHGVT